MKNNHPKPITRERFIYMLQHIPSVTKELIGDVAAALKQLFPGEDRQNLEDLIGFGFDDAAGPINEQEKADWKALYDAVAASAEAVARVRAAAVSGGDTDAGHELVQQEQKRREEGKIAVIDYVLALVEKLPPVRYKNQEFYFYEEGVWRVKDRAVLSAPVMEVLAHKDNHSRMIDLVIDTLAHKVTWLGKFNSAACFSDDGRTVLICCPSGVLKVSADKVEKLEHSPEYNFCRALAADYDDKAQCPHFDDAVQLALPGEAVLDRQTGQPTSQMSYADQERLRWFGGWMLYPANPFKKSLCNLGESNSRKGTVMLHGFAEVIGPASYTTLSLAQICDERDYQRPSMLESMVNFSTELNNFEIKDSSSFKTVAAGERTSCRNIYKRPYHVEDYPLKLVFLANNKPRFKNGTTAEYNRIEFLAFSNALAPEAVNEGYQAKVRAEKNGVFSQWMVPGLQSILRGERLPEASRAAKAQKADFGLDNDPLMTFLKERMEFDPEKNRNDSLEREDFEGYYAAWCEDHGVSLNWVPHGWKEAPQRVRHLYLSRPRKGRSANRPWVMYGIQPKPDARKAEDYKKPDRRKNKWDGLDED